MILSIYACGAAAWLCGAVRRLRRAQLRRYGAAPPLWSAKLRRCGAMRLPLERAATALESHTTALRSHATALRCAAAALRCCETAPQRHATALRDIWRRESEWWWIPRYGAAGLWGSGV